MGRACPRELVTQIVCEIADKASKEEIYLPGEFYLSYLYPSFVSVGAAGDWI